MCFILWEQRKKNLSQQFPFFFSVRCCQPCFLWKNRKGGRERDRERKKERESRWGFKPTPSLSWKMFQSAGDTRSTTPIGMIKWFVSKMNYHVLYLSMFSTFMCSPSFYFISSYIFLCLYLYILHLLWVSVYHTPNYMTVLPCHNCYFKNLLYIHVCMSLTLIFHYPIAELWVLYSYLSLYL